MRWRKLGLVWGPDGSRSWARTHAMAPTPFRLDDGTLRVYVTCLDEKGRGRPGYVDVSTDDPTKVMRVGEGPLLDLGEPGTFDDNGVLALSLVQKDPGTLLMFYAGFELCAQIRYRIFTGLALSLDGGRTFQRSHRHPILDRTDQELFFRGGAFALREEGLVKLWYVAGSQWTELNGKPMPVYDLHYLESPDGVVWSGSSRLSLPLTDPDEHGFGRPWVVRRKNGTYQLFYSIRRRSLAAYRLGYAESSDGVRWDRKDAEMGLDVSADGFDAKAIMYAAVISAGNRTYCFYNGDNFGEKGFGVAELLP